MSFWVRCLEKSRNEFMDKGGVSKREGKLIAAKVTKLQHERKAPERAAAEAWWSRSLYFLRLPSIDSFIKAPADLLFPHLQAFSFQSWVQGEGQPCD